MSLCMVYCSRKQDHEFTQGLLLLCKQEHEFTQGLLLSCKQDHEFTQGLLLSCKQDQEFTQGLLLSCKEDHEFTQGLLLFCKEDHEVIQGLLLPCQRISCTPKDQLFYVTLKLFTDRWKCVWLIQLYFPVFCIINIISAWEFIVLKKIIKDSLFPS